MASTASTEASTTVPPTTIEASIAPSTTTEATTVAFTTLAASTNAPPNDSKYLHGFHHLHELV